MVSEGMCYICADIISDPVCNNCYIKRTKILLRDYKFGNLEDVLIIEKIKKKLSFESLNNASCILCNGENVSICYYCYSISLSRLLEEINFPEELIDISRGYYSDSDEI